MDATLRTVGDRWSALIIAAYFVLGARRFEDFQTALQIPRGTLTARLRHLVSQRVLTTRPYQHSPERHEYVATPGGEDFLEYLACLLGWVERWYRTAPLAWHLSCGKPAHPRCVCSRCSKPLDRRQVDVRSGPGGGKSECLNV